MRLCREHQDHPDGEATVRRYVQVRKRELVLSGRESFVPQSYELGQEAQVPTVGANFVPLAEQAVKESHSHIRYLEALLSAVTLAGSSSAITWRILSASFQSMLLN